MLDHQLTELNKQKQKLILDLERDFVNIIPEREQLVTYLVGWLFNEIVMTEYFMGIEALLSIADGWLREKKSRLS